MLGGLPPSTAFGVAVALLVAPGCVELLDVDDWHVTSRASGGGEGGGGSSGAVGGATSSGGQATGGAAAGGGGTAGSGGSGCPSAPPATALACGQNKPRAVLARGGWVYWVNEGDGAVRRVPLAGGAIEDLAAPLGSPCAIAATLSHVFWRNHAGEIWRWPFSGGSAEVVFSGQTDHCSLAADTDHVYWTTIVPATISGSVLKAPTAVIAMPEVIVSATKTLGPLAVDDTDVYWGYDGTSVFRAAKTQLDQITSFMAAIGPCGLALSNDDMLWTETTTNVYRVPKNGLASDKVLLSGQESAPCALVSAPPFVLWATATVGGAIRRVDVNAPGVVTNVATGFANPCAIALEGSEVVWTTCDDGGVWKARAW